MRVSIDKHAILFSEKPPLCCSMYFFALGFRFLTALYFVSTFLVLNNSILPSALPKHDGILLWREFWWFWWEEEQVLVSAVPLDDSKFTILSWLTILITLLYALDLYTLSRSLFDRQFSFFLNDRQLFILLTFLRVCRHWCATLWHYKYSCSLLFSYLDWQTTVFGMMNLAWFTSPIFVHCLFVFIERGRKRIPCRDKAFRHCRDTDSADLIQEMRLETLRNARGLQDSTPHPDPALSVH